MQDHRIISGPDCSSLDIFSSMSTSFWATSTYALDTTESGFDITMGTPSSLPSLTVGSNGIWEHKPPKHIRSKTNKQRWLLRIIM